MIDIIINYNANMFEPPVLYPPGITNCDTPLEINSLVSESDNLNIKSSGNLLKFKLTKNATEIRLYLYRVVNPHGSTAIKLILLSWNFLSSMARSDLQYLQKIKNHEPVANCDRRRLFISFQDYIVR